MHDHLKNTCTIVRIFENISTSFTGGYGVRDSSAFALAFLVAVGWAGTAVICFLGSFICATIYKRGPKLKSK